MKYSIIYTADCGEETDVEQYAPPEGLKFQETEGDMDCGDVWPEGHHRKWVALLDPEEFDEFVRHCNLCYNPYGGEGSSLGAPGCGTSIVPAFIFDCEYGSNGGGIIANGSANVTPVLGRSGTQEDWQRIRKEMSVYE